MLATNYFSNKFLSAVNVTSSVKSTSKKFKSDTFKNGIVVAINNRSFVATTKGETLSKSNTSPTIVLCIYGSNTGLCNVGFVSSSKPTITTTVLVRRTFFSSKEQKPYTSRLYPFATEPPEINSTIANKEDSSINQIIKSRTSAERHMPPTLQHLNTLSSTIQNMFSKICNNIGITKNDTLSPLITAKRNGNTLQEKLLDPFDDQLTIKDEEVIQILQEQKQSLVTKPPNTTPISVRVPEGIPKLKPSSQLDIPKTQVTTLDNGIRIVSCNRHNTQNSLVGIIAEFGSITEQYANNNRGVINVLEMLTFAGSTRSINGKDIIEQIKRIGGVIRYRLLGKEQSKFLLDCSRTNLKDAIQLLNEIIIHPKFDTDEINDIKSILMNTEPSMLSFHRVFDISLLAEAYGPDSPIGQNHYVSNSLIQKITSQTCIDYWKNELLTNPRNIIIAGVNIDNHEQFVQFIQTQTDFPSLQQTESTRTSPIIQSNYIGGDFRDNIPFPPIQQRDMVKIAIGFEIGGYILPESNNYNDCTNVQKRNDDLITLQVLQTVLGGGSTSGFNGLGLGMNTRLYQNILNTYDWVDTIQTFTYIHKTNGIFGISGIVSEPIHAHNLTLLIIDHILKLTQQHVTNEELVRAKNMLKFNLLTSMESKLTIFKNMTEDLFWYGQQESIQETIQKIDSVSAEDIRQLLIKAITVNSMYRPTFGAMGDDISSVPSYEEIISMFQNVPKYK